MYVYDIANILTDKDGVGMEKLAVIDLGSNSIRMSIYEINPDKSFCQIGNYRKMVKLSEGMNENMCLQPEPQLRTVNAILEFRQIMQKEGVTEVRCVATAAMRKAKNGKEFELIKFRSMRVDAEADGVARLSTGDNDDRITPVGKVIRKLRLDELPQLLNIVQGSMSIVGPRPERPSIAAQYEETLPEFRLRLQAKAGLTGYAQVYGKYNSTPKEKLQMDMIYISNPSIFEDIKLILTTLRVLFMKESTEGFEKQLVTNSADSSN